MQHPVLSALEGAYHYERLRQEAEKHRLQNRTNNIKHKWRKQLLSTCGKWFITLGEWLQADDTSLTQKPVMH